MGGDGDAAQAQEERAAVLAIVQSGAHPAKRRNQEKGRKAGERGAGEFLAKCPQEHLGHGLGALHHQVADEAVGHHHIGGAGKHILRLDVAQEVEVGGLAEQGVGFPDQAVSFAFLLPIGEEGHPGAGKAIDLSGIDRAHAGELEEVFGAAVGIGPGIQEEEKALPGGEGSGQGRPFHAGQAAQDKRGGGHDGPAVAGRDKGLGLAVPHQPHPDHDGGIAFAPHRLGGMLIHGDDLRRMDDGEGEAGGIVPGDFFPHHLLRADQEDFHTIGPGSLHRSGHGGLRGQVSAHGIQSNAHRHPPGRTSDSHRSGYRWPERPSAGRSRCAIRRAVPAVRPPGWRCPPPPRRKPPVAPGRPGGSGKRAERPPPPVRPGSRPTAPARRPADGPPVGRASGPRRSPAKNPDEKCRRCSRPCEPPQAHPKCTTPFVKRQIGCRFCSFGAPAIFVGAGLKPAPTRAKHPSNWLQILFLWSTIQLQARQKLPSAVLSRRKAHGRRSPGRVHPGAPGGSGTPGPYRGRRCARQDAGLGWRPGGGILSPQRSQTATTPPPAGRPPGRTVRLSGRRTGRDGRFPQRRGTPRPGRIPHPGAHRSGPDLPALWRASSGEREHAPPAPPFGCPAHPVAQQLFGQTRRHAGHGRGRRPSSGQLHRTIAPGPAAHRAGDSGDVRRGRADHRGGRLRGAGLWHAAAGHGLCLRPADRPPGPPRRTGPGLPSGGGGDAGLSGDGLGRGPSGGGPDAGLGRPPPPQERGRGPLRPGHSGGGQPRGRRVGAGVEDGGRQRRRAGHRPGPAGGAEPVGRAYAGAAGEPLPLRFRADL